MKLLIHADLHKELTIALISFVDQLNLYNSTGVIKVGIRDKRKDKIKDVFGYVIDEGVFRRVYYIYINKLNTSLNQRLMTLSHEMIHVHQLETKKLQYITSNLIYWDGIHINPNNMEWGDKPWEIDAVERQCFLLNEYFNKKQHITIREYYNNNSLYTKLTNYIRIYKL